MDGSFIGTIVQLFKFPYQWPVLTLLHAIVIPLLYSVLVHCYYCSIAPSFILTLTWSWHFFASSYLIFRSQSLSHFWAKSGHQNSWIWSIVSYADIIDLLWYLVVLESKMTDLLSRNTKCFINLSNILAYIYWHSCLVVTLLHIAQSYWKYWSIDGNGIVQVCLKSILM